MRWDDRTDHVMVLLQNPPHPFSCRRDRGNCPQKSKQLEEGTARGGCGVVLSHRLFVHGVGDSGTHTVPVGPAPGSTQCPAKIMAGGWLGALQMSQTARN